MPSAREDRRSAAPKTSVADVYAALDQLAPFAGAEEWDNVGLLAGRPEWPARRLLVALDLTDAVAREALRKKVDALVVYHPPIWKGIRAITPQAESPTGLLPDLLAGRIAILATHTAFDVAVGGSNDLLLDLFEPVARRPLEADVRAGDEFKLVVFVPAAEVRSTGKAGSGVPAEALQAQSCSPSSTTAISTLSSPSMSPSAGSGSRSRVLISNAFVNETSHTTAAVSSIHHSREGVTTKISSLPSRSTSKSAGDPEVCCASPSSSNNRPSSKPGRTVPSALTTQIAPNSG